MVLTWMLISNPASHRLIAVVSQEGTELRIGFWQLRKLHDGSRNMYELKQIARAIRDFDCVALGDVYDDRVLSQMVNELEILGGRWNKVRSPKRIGNRLTNTQRYGILYRSDKLTVRGRPRIPPEVEFALPGQAVVQPFDRQPLFCSLATRDGRFDFTFVVVDVTADELFIARRSAPANKIRRRPSLKAVQIAEVRTLHDYYLLAKASDPGDDDIVLVGNLKCDWRAPEMNQLLGASANLIDLIDPSHPTAIDGSNTHSHIVIPGDALTEFTGAFGVVAFDQTQFGGDLSRARQACSDQRPVWIQVRIPAADDD